MFYCTFVEWFSVVLTSSDESCVSSDCVTFCGMTAVMVPCTGVVGRLFCMAAESENTGRLGEGW